MEDDVTAASEERDDSRERGASALPEEAAARSAARSPSFSRAEGGPPRSAYALKRERQQLQWEMRQAEYVLRAASLDPLPFKRGCVVCV